MLNAVAVRRGYVVQMRRSEDMFRVLHLHYSQLFLLSSHRDVVDREHVA